MAKHTPPMTMIDKIVGIAFCGALTVVSLYFSLWLICGLMRLAIGA
jgi:hypothetical protein